MTLFIGLVSQKGGVGKSTLARLLAREYANAGWRVKIADMDVSQGTSCEWARVRMDSAITPEIAAEQFPRVDRALAQAEQFDLIIFDGAPHSTRDTLSIAKSSDLVILPTGFSLDDLKPTVRLAHESLTRKSLSFSRGQGIAPPNIRKPLFTWSKQDMPYCPAICRTEQHTVAPVILAVRSQKQLTQA